MTKQITIEETRKRFMMIFILKEVVSGTINDKDSSLALVSVVSKFLHITRKQAVLFIQETLGLNKNKVQG